MPSIYPLKFNENAAHSRNWLAKKLAVLPCPMITCHPWNDPQQTESWLVVAANPSEKYDFVNWDDDFLHMEK
jgi:hypothetical protein